MHGLKAALFERAQALGVSPSGLVRTTLAEALGRSDPINTHRSMQSLWLGNGDRVRLCLRMGREQGREDAIKRDAQKHHIGWIAQL